MSSKNKEKINLFWFRRDLRLDDNIGLYEALSSNLPVLPIFIFDKNILDKLEDKEDKRVSFIHQVVSNMKEELNEMGSDLQLFYGDPIEVWKEILDKFNFEKVFYNEDYEPYALKRDKKVQDFLIDNKKPFLGFKDHCIFAKDDVLKKDGTPYTVYTPFKNKWYERLEPKDISSYNNKKHFKNFHQTSKSQTVALARIGFKECESDFYQRTIKTSIIKDYDKTRDLPALRGTSRLGLHLRFGTVSIRKCAQIGKELNKTWLDELIWRDFFSQILFHFPQNEKKCFKEKYENIPWINDKKQFKLWCEGKTGYPLVDAGMRELNETGFMHNRVRMVTGSFLVKHLLIDWRWGERYFAEKLLDFDMASNNGNWQWVAGTGCDASPYFRIFNPETQFKKFDPDKEYVKKWVPEYGTDKYSEPMIEHKFAYDRALGTYKKAIN